MPKNYSKLILLIIGLIVTLNIIYFVYSTPVLLKNETQQITTFKNRTVEGALQPLPLINTISKEWAILGKALFNSTLLSLDNTISCASCHRVNDGGADVFPVSLGINNSPGTRNSPTVLNSALNFRQFWDGRSLSLAEQVSGPIHNPVEMGANFELIIKRLNESTIFKSAFDELTVEGITQNTIVKAITIYEESLITYGAPIDEYLLGDENALNTSEKRGLVKFERFGCITCHQGRNIGGNIFQKLGVIDEAPLALLKDKGLYEVTRNEKDLHVFKVPSLRNIALTAPYFHDGSVHSLHDAVKLMGRLQLGVSLKDEDVDDIVSLLHAFTGKVTELEVNQ